MSKARIGLSKWLALTNLAQYSIAKSCNIVDNEPHNYVVALEWYKTLIDKLGVDATLDIIHAKYVELGWDWMV